MIKVLFICHGNICRSPTAEFLFKDMAAKAGLSDRIYVESAATTADEIGNPVYPPARKKLAEHGIDCAGKTARRMMRRDYDDFDLIIGMDAENMSDMRRICGRGDKLHLLLDYTDSPRDVADPWYTRDFDAAWRDIEAGCRCLLAALEKEL